MCSVRKGISILLGILMLAGACIGALPMVAYAAPGDEGSPAKTGAELKQAIEAAAESGGDIYIASMVLDETIEIDNTKAKIRLIGVDNAVLTLAEANKGRHFAIGTGAAEAIDFRDLTIKGRGIEDATKSGNPGGGIEAADSYAKALSFYNCIIEGNVAVAGGGIKAPTVYLQNTLVNANAAYGSESEEGNGGGVYANIIKTANATIYKNQSKNHGGGLVGETVALLSTTVSGNIATKNGAAIYMTGSKAPETRGLISAGNYNGKGESSNVARKVEGDGDPILVDILEPGEKNGWSYIGPLTEESKTLVTEEMMLTEELNVLVGKLENGGVKLVQESALRDIIPSASYETWFGTGNATAMDKDIRGKNRIQNNKVDSGSVEISVPGITITNMPESMVVGQSIALKYNIENEGADYNAETVEFSSGDPETIKVEGDKLTALRETEKGVEIKATVEKNILPFTIKVGKADKASLRTLITEADKLKENGYTAESWDAFKTALTAAKEIVAKDAATEEEISKAMTDLAYAMAGLEEEEEKFDREKLDEFIDVALELSEGDYTAESWAKLNDKLAAATKVKDDEDATEEQIHKATAELKAALDALEENDDTTYDRDALKALIEEAEKLLDKEADYTVASWKTFANTLTMAKAGYEKEDETEDRINAFAKALKKAMNSLVKKSEETFDKAALAIIIKEVKDLNKLDYTEESWKKVEEALAAATEINGKSDATDEEMTKAGRELRAAIDALEKIAPVIDKSQLNAAVTKAEGLAEADYTPETWEPMKAALAAAKAVQAKEEADQDEIDGAATALNTAINALKKKNDIATVNKANLQAAIAKAAGLSKAEYTEATWAAMITALNNANYINTKANATQDEVDGATTALNNSITALAKLDVAFKEYPTIGNWQNDSSGRKAKDASGSEIMLNWGLDKSSNTWYYFDDKGYTVNGKWVQVADRYRTKHWYYLKSDGKMVTGWQKLDNSWYFFSLLGGNRKDQWQYIDNYWYYLGNDGKMLTSWLKENNKWYYLTGSGKMAKGYMMLESNGVKRWFDFDTRSGVMDDQLTSTGWLKSGNNWVFSVNGAATKGWQMIESEWYYFNSEGYMQTGWIQLGNVWYYLKPDGAMATGWAKDDGRWYYLTPHSGAMVVGQYEIDGKVNIFNSSGSWIS